MQGGKNTNNGVCGRWAVTLLGGLLRLAPPLRNLSHAYCTVVAQVLIWMGADLWRGLLCMLDGTGSYARVLEMACGVVVVAQLAILPIHARSPDAAYACSHGLGPPLTGTAPPHRPLGTAPFVNLALTTALSYMPLAAAASLRQHLAIAVHAVHSSLPPS